MLPMRTPLLTLPLALAALAGCTGTVRGRMGTDLRPSIVGTGVRVYEAKLNV